jgi:hypothetical protein
MIDYFRQLCNLLAHFVVKVWEDLHCLVCHFQRVVNVEDTFEDPVTALLQV